MAAYRLARREPHSNAIAALHLLTRSCHCLRAAPCTAVAVWLWTRQYHVGGVL